MVVLRDESCERIIGLCFEKLNSPGLERLDFVRFYGYFELGIVRFFAALNTYINQGDVILARSASWLVQILCMARVLVNRGVEKLTET